jgi:hypothetical protein
MISSGVVEIFTMAITIDAARQTTKTTIPIRQA